MRIWSKPKLEGSIFDKFLRKCYNTINYNLRENQLSCKYAEQIAVGEHKLKLSYVFWTLLTSCLIVLLQ